MTVVTTTRRRSPDDGAAAVEFALLAPLLMMLVLGVINFGIIFNVQETLTQAAREGVRGLALQLPGYDVSATTTQAAVGVSSPLITSSGCSGGAQTAWVQVTKDYSFIGMPFLPSVTLRGKAYMRCGG